jgi:hypothetical protein
MEDYKQIWIVTNSGKKFHPFNPNPDDISLLDIAHSLSLQCRWNGHIDSFYSVAQHSVMVSRIVEEIDPEHSLEALMHDAAEAFTSDVPLPIKMALPDFMVMEKRVEKAISEKFSLNFPWPKSIKKADRIALNTEAIHLFDHDVLNLLDINVDTSRNDFWIEPWYPTEAETQFLRRWNDLK